MKITNVKVGTKLVNKVNNLVYKVTEVTGTDKDKIAIAESFDSESNEIYDSKDLNYDKLEITKLNDICFRIIYTPKNTDVPKGYTVEQGLLMKDGVPVTDQGQIVVEKIIAALPGYLLIGVKPRSKKEDLIDLFTYDPEEDEFKKLIRSASIPVPYVLKENEDSIILGYNQTHTEAVLDEDGNETGKYHEIFERAAIMVIHDKVVDSAFLSRPMALELIPIKGSESDYLMGTTVDIDENMVIKVVSKPYYEMVSVKDNCIYSNPLKHQPNKEVVSVSMVNIEDYGVVLKGKDYILYNELRIDSPLVEKISGDYLVDIAYEDHELIVTMADDEYNVSSIVRKDTKDRGYIVNLV